MDEPRRHPVDDFRLSDGTYMLDGRIVTDRDTAVSILEELGAETEPASGGMAAELGGGEWGYVLRMVEEEDRHPSDEHLARLVRQHGVPEFAQEYVASRMGKGPGSRPFREPDDYGMFGRFTARQATALMEMVWLYPELAEYETTEPGPLRRTIPTNCLFPLDSDSLETISIEVELWKVESRGVWRVRDPKRQAREIVAKRHGVKAPTLRDWEREFRDSDDPLGQVL